MTRKQPTIQQFKKWCRDHRSLALAVCEAMAFSQVERERVNSYILPLFKEWDFKDETGQPITNPDRLYRCNDEDYCKAYYAACDEAHRKHGFTGEQGHCPALIAERLLIIAENALIEMGKPLFGIEVYMLNSDERRKYLDLLVGACINIEREAA